MEYRFLSTKHLDPIRTWMLSIHSIIFEFDTESATHTFFKESLVFEYQSINHTFQLVTGSNILLHRFSRQINIRKLVDIVNIRKWCLKWNIHLTRENPLLMFSILFKWLWLLDLCLYFELEYENKIWSNLDSISPQYLFLR